MKRSKNQLQSKTSFITLLQLIYLNLDQNCLKGLKVTKMASKLGLKGFGASKKVFPETIIYK